MKHLDLFTGIGGFALATEWAFGEVEHEFVEYDPFCQEVLKKHWPNSKIHGDIRTFIADAQSAESRRVPNKQGENVPSSWESGVFILTGGFPCQPFSQAGRRGGTSDDRYLWPEMFRVIQLAKPTWVIAENVRGLLTWNEGMVFEQVCSDLENEGYEVQPLIIPAVAVNAPHRRDRIWFVAHKSGERRTRDGIQRKGRLGQRGGDRYDQGENSDVENPVSVGSRGRMESDGQVLGSKRTEVKDARPSWEKNWIEVAAELCSLDDGLPARMGDINISASRHRKEQLKAYGNSIVPQVAYQIMASFAEIMSDKK